MNTKKHFSLLFAVAASVWFMLPFALHAAMLGVVINNTAPNINQPFRVDVPLDTQGDNANAIQGQILFPHDQFTLQSISDGQSPINFWIEAPAEIASGVVAFSGITPGGFQGAVSSVVSLWLLPTRSGTGDITLGSVELLRNDGNATPIPTSAGSSTITVSADIATSTATRTASFINPETFTPVVSREEHIFGGQYFLVFSTTDKGSGIDHYEVLEAPSYSWQVATSPYLLQDQALESDVYVRAVDHAGNFIVVEVPARHPVGEQTRHVQSQILLVALSVLLIMTILLAWTWLRPKRNRVL